MTLFGKIILGGLLVVVAGGVYYGVSTKVANDTQADELVIATTTDTVPVVVMATTTASTTKEVPTGKKMAFTEFMKQGGSYKCTVTQNVANMISNGTVYIHNNKIKANFTTSIQGQTIETNMIAMEGYTYTWTNMSKGAGFKSKITPPKSDPNTNAAASATYTWNGEQIGDYNCEAWVVDTTTFELPKSVTFTLQ